MSRRACYSCGVSYPDDNAWCKTVTGSKWPRDGQVEIQNMIKSYASHRRTDIIETGDTIVFDGFLGIGFEISKGSFGSIFAADFVDGQYKYTTDDADSEYIIHNWVTCRVIVKLFPKTSDNDDGYFLKEVIDLVLEM